MISFHASSFFVVFFFSAPATTAIYTLSLHDALPISARLPARSCRTDRRAYRLRARRLRRLHGAVRRRRGSLVPDVDRKSTRLNSSHANISYAVFCLKKKKKKKQYDAMLRAVGTARRR